jgi:hypothetical protein
VPQRSPRGVGLVYVPTVILRVAAQRSNAAEPIRLKRRHRRRIVVGGTSEARNAKASSDWDCFVALESLVVRDRAQTRSRERGTRTPTAAVFLPGSATAAAIPQMGWGCISKPAGRPARRAASVGGSSGSQRLASKRQPLTLSASRETT